MKIKELLSSSRKWTKGAFAKDESGSPVASMSYRAVCYCLIGATRHCYNNPDDQNNILSIIEAKIKQSIPSWNDAPERTFDDIRKLVEELDI